jgi:16S rRNA (uracil1498-N3)-methyltransferase
MVELGLPISPTPEPPVRVSLAVALLKGDQMDTVVREATMLGVYEIVPVASTHVAVPAAARRAPAALERWHRVAVASAKQCGRAVVPAIAPVTPFDRVIGPKDGRPVLMCVEPARAAGPPAAVSGAAPVDAVVLVGPEGGWTDDEIAQAVYCGVKFMHLGPRTLRAETAPTVALTALWSAWGW